MKIFIAFLAGLGGLVLFIGMVLGFILIKGKLSRRINKWKWKRKKGLHAKHKVKIPVYCCECDKWGGSKEPNESGCPMRNYCTGEFDYCSRGTKER